MRQTNIHLKATDLTVITYCSAASVRNALIYAFGLQMELNEAHLAHLQLTVTCPASLSHTLIIWLITHKLITVVVKEKKKKKKKGNSQDRVQTMYRGFISH